jgi:siroheme synthase (precorrin-2 oxidase/ferrochelatase)
MKKSNKYDYYVAIIDKDPVLSNHIRNHIQNHIDHYLSKRVCVTIEKSLYDILSMPWAQNLQLCILEPFDDLKENRFDDKTVQNHLAYMKQNKHISFIIYSQFSDPEKRYKDESIPYYLKWAQQDDLVNTITEAVTNACMVK